MKIVITLIFTLTFNLAYALPKQVDIIFLAAKKTAHLKELTKDQFPIVLRALAQNDEKCLPMGDGCFHPQLGYIEGKS
ncbi:hypothetical protein, partial [Bacteriovorax sp. DB6_IX]|uniref:hypothetical protein n=1 Tax=Bacteriovorax sp. DB6_IX TaxID=1353530 RepID=UPI00038A4CB6